MKPDVLDFKKNEMQLKKKHVIKKLKFCHLLVNLRKWKTRWPTFNASLLHRRGSMMSLCPTKTRMELQCMNLRR